jgi:glutamate racemase
VLEINKLFPNVQVFQQACPMWVPIVENNEVDSEGARFFIKRDLDSLLNQHPEIDTILLGCTHYPVLYPLIRSLLPDNIHIITQGNIVAKSLVDYLKRHPEIDICCNRHADIEYVTTGPNDEFDTYTSEFMGGDVHSTRLDLHKLSKVSYEKI